ncbi:hypothetical protein [Methanothermobacter marburgensis]|uniref:hypothetical protein n=1 Tax=Methanothermobacter marburgensis TaxID=145263 RepID=UPI0035B87521
MTTPKRFSFLRRKKVKLDGTEVELEGYRVVDSEYVIPLIEKRNEALEIGATYQQFILDLEKKKENEISKDDAKKIKELKDRIDKLTVEVSRISYPLAQRGLKRALYRDTKEYKEAEAQGTLTEYIDSLPDVELAPYMVTEIVNIMLELGNPDIIGVSTDELDPRGTENTEKKSGTRRRSGSPSKGKSTNSA